MKSKWTKITAQVSDVSLLYSTESWTPIQECTSPEPTAQSLLNLKPRRCCGVTQSWELPEELAELRMSSCSAQAPSELGASLRFTKPALSNEWICVGRMIVMGKASLGCLSNNAWVLESLASISYQIPGYFSCKGIISFISWSWK